VKTLKQSVAEFLKVNQLLGYKMRHHQIYLNNFVLFMKSKRAAAITSNLALEWAMLPKDVTPHTWAFRLGVIRCFARYRQAKDKRTEIPSTDLLPIRYRRRHPYIYKKSEVRKLLMAAKSPSNSFWGLSNNTLYYILGLAAATGLRRSEILKLNLDDVDLINGVLTIKMTKFRKSRLVPLHPTVIKKLQQYVRRRLIQANSKTDAFFVTKRGIRLTTPTLNFGFLHASIKAGLRKSGEPFGPRLHDLRHTFAVNTLIRWLREADEIDNKIPALSTYLGHVNPKSTHWYFSCVPELMRLVRLKMEKADGGIL